MRTSDARPYNYFYAGGKLMRQTGGGNTLDFFYDESGHPYALKYNGTTYYYVTNLQGDVLHIANNAGTAVVSYTYDPYGKPLTTTGSMASTLGAHNPLRYRGYVYDSETGFYYLQSRYYDPTICRFINADSYASTGQGIIGHNMFTYCNNNPIAHADPSGHALMFCLKDDHDPTLGMFIGLTGGGGGGGAAYALSATNHITNTIREIEELVNNTNPAVTQADLETNGYGFYRGKLVVKLDIMGDAAFSFGIIFTGPKPDGNLLDHEYGHTVHLDQIGVVSYATKVVLPSVISFWIYNNNPYYESQPWEYIAEYFGQPAPPPNGYLKCADELALLYWMYTLLP